MTLIILVIVCVLLFLILKTSSRKGIDSKVEIEYKDNEDLGGLHKRALKKQITEDFMGAIAVSDKILALEPMNYGVLLIRADCLAALNYHLDSIEDYEKALKINNSDPNIFALLGTAYIFIGEFDKGLENLRISVKMGCKIYQWNYEMLSEVSEEMKKLMIKKGRKPENLKKRNVENFQDDLSDVDMNELREGFMNNANVLKRLISLDPNNPELKNLYKSARNQFE